MRFTTMRYVMVAALVAAGCTAPNAEFVPDLAGWGPAPDLTGYALVPTPDLTVLPDFATLPDLAEGPLPTVDGTFLVGLSTIIAPGNPLAFLARFTSTREGTAVELQPLSAVDGNGDGRPDRTPVGSPLPAVSTMFFRDDSVLVYLGAVGIQGSANPISGSDINTTLLFKGKFYGADYACGGAMGQFEKPFRADLAGSTWSAVRVDPKLSGEALPPVTYNCR